MYLKSPRRRREKILILKCFEKYRCVPKIASPEERTNFTLQILQGHASKNPGAEPSAGRMYYKPCIIDSRAKRSSRPRLGGGGGGEEEGEGVGEK